MDRDRRQSAAPPARVVREAAGSIAVGAGAAPARTRASARTGVFSRTRVFARARPIS